MALVLSVSKGILNWIGMRVDQSFFDKFYFFLLGPHNSGLRSLQEEEKKIKRGYVMFKSEGDI